MPAPGARFDARRARSDAIALAEMGPRAPGSEAVERARDLVADRLGAAGLFVWRATARGKDVPRGVVGDVGLVASRVSGRSGREVLLVTATVDGSRDGPDLAHALGPAILVGVARALRTGDRPRHTVVLLATESAGHSLGARAIAACLGSSRARPTARARLGCPETLTAALRGPGHRVAAEIAVEPRGLAGDAALLWAGPGAAPLVDAWARAVDTPAGGAHFARLMSEQPFRRPWPAAAVGTRRAAVAPGGPRDVASSLSVATVRTLGQAVLDLVRSTDADPDRALRRHVDHGRLPAFVELPLHVVVPIGSRTAAVLGWLAVVAALWSLGRQRRLLAPLALSLPWGAAAAALSIGVMNVVSGALAAQRGTAAPLRATPFAHLACVTLSGLWVLLAWQRVGVRAPLRRLAVGLSQPAVLAVLSVIALTAATVACLILAPPLVPMMAVPLFVAAFSAAAVARAQDRRGRFVAAIPVVVALALTLGPALADGAALVLARGRIAGPSHLDLALGIAAVSLPTLPALAAAATASILRPGVGQLGLLAVVTGALAVWTATAPPATVAHPRRVVVTAVSDARPGHSLFLIDAQDAVRVEARAAGRPWFAAAIAGGSEALVVHAPDGLTAPPWVRVNRTTLDSGAWRVEAQLRSLRRAEAIALVLPPRTRIWRASIPLIRRTPRDPWVARMIAPPAAGIRVILEVTLPLGSTLRDIVALDSGTATIGPLVPRIDRAWPTRQSLRGVGVTPLDTVYAPLPPPPTLPPDDPPLPPAGPEPWWSIMARERYRQQGSSAQPPR